MATPQDGSARVCWSSQDQEPNDGYIELDEARRIRCEHKLIPQFSQQEALKAILETFEKYSALGEAYGRHRHLIIHANQETKGLIKISSLSDRIDGKSIFDKVFLLGFVGVSNGAYCFVFSEQFPGLLMKHLRIEGGSGELLAPRSPG